MTVRVWNARYSNASAPFPTGKSMQTISCKYEKYAPQDSSIFKRTLFIQIRRERTDTLLFRDFEGQLEIRNKL